MADKKEKVETQDSVSVVGATKNNRRRYPWVTAVAADAARNDAIATGVHTPPKNQEPQHDPALDDPIAEQILEGMSEAALINQMMELAAQSDTDDD